jgi:hypothetical protein
MTGGKERLKCEMKCCRRQTGVRYSKMKIRRYCRQGDMQLEMGQEWLREQQLQAEKRKSDNWLGDRDSNPDRQSQSLLSCH